MLKVFMQALRDRGNDVSLLPGASDRHGEDGLLLLNGREITVQIVTMPAEAGRWSELRVQASANQAGTGLEAVQMVRQAIEKKASARGNLLALDAAHYGALVSPGLVEAYVSEYGDPALEFSFIQVWIIGPTARSSTCLARV